MADAPGRSVSATIRVSPPAASGADGAQVSAVLDELYALHPGIIRALPAYWDRHGWAAGPIRNQQWLGEGKPDLVVAFPGGRDTADMVHRAEAAGVPVLKVPNAC